jgi:hypothetical protein
MKTNFHHHDYDQLKEKIEDEVHKALFSQKQVLLEEPEATDRRLARFSSVDSPSKSSARFKQ